jgi:hypothetical protein
MFQDSVASNPERDLEDRSMRIVEYAMAIAALVVAGLLAVLR